MLGGGYILLTTGGESKGYGSLNRSVPVTEVILLGGAFQWVRSFGEILLVNLI